MPSISILKVTKFQNLIWRKLWQTIGFHAVFPWTVCEKLYVLSLTFFGKKGGELFHGGILFKLIQEMYLVLSLHLQIYFQRRK
jgi:hypothetical protein